MKQKLLTLMIMPWGRVGSNMVNDILNRSHGVTVYNEPHTDIRSKNASLGEEEIALRQAKWLDDISSADLDSPTLINHAALSTADAGSFATWIDRTEPNLITLDRRDDLAVAISTARTELWVKKGEEIGEFRNWSVDKRVSFCPVIDPQNIRTRIAYVRSGREIMNALIGDKKRLSLYYEDLVADLDGCMTAILRSMELPRRHFEVTTGKFGSNNLSQMIANPDDFIDIIAEESGRTSIEV